MKFDEALIYLKAGKKVKRSTWGKEYHISTDNKKLCYDNGAAASFIGCDILADDWELVREPIERRTEAYAYWGLADPNGFGHQERLGVKDFALRKTPNCNSKVEIIVREIPE